MPFWPPEGSVHNLELPSGYPAGLAAEHSYASLLLNWTSQGPYFLLLLACVLTRNWPAQKQYVLFPANSLFEDFFSSIANQALSSDPWPSILSTGSVSIPSSVNKTSKKKGVYFCVYVSVFMDVVYHAFLVFREARSVRTQEMLQISVSHHVGARKQTQVLCNSGKCSSPLLNHLSSPQPALLFCH